MNITLRIVLVCAALLVWFFMLHKIRKGQLRVSDSIFWILFASSFILLALFPRIAFFLSDFLGVESPSNLVFMYVILVLLIKEFGMSVHIAKLEQQVTKLVQEQALDALKQNSYEQITKEEPYS